VLEKKYLTVTLPILFSNTFITLSVSKIEAAHIYGVLRCILSPNCYPKKTMLRGSKLAYKTVAHFFHGDGAWKPQSMHWALRVFV
jgi:hypothetical protein